MFISYYSPNITIFKILRAFFIRNAEIKVMKYFQKLTGKKNILLTNSCRSALYLSYKSLINIKKIITSPLTCTMALSPIVNAEKELHFCDIDKKTLVIDYHLLVDQKNNDEAIQVIHLGGYPVDVEKIKEKGYYVIEDCAQALGSKRNAKSVGSFGDIACFSLMKMGYGISGGVLATDDNEIFSKAKSLQDEWPRIGWKIILFRIVRSILETKQNHSSVRFILQKFLAITDEKRAIASKEFSGCLRKPRSFFFKVFAVQMDYLDELHKKRKEKLNEFKKRVQSTGWTIQEIEKDEDILMNVGKLFLHNDQIENKKIISDLAKNRIDAKHLEQRNEARVQKRLDQDMEYNCYFQKNKLSSYLSVHDHLISLPLRENLSDNEIDKIVKYLKKGII